MTIKNYSILINRDRILYEKFQEKIVIIVYNNPIKGFIFWKLVKMY